MDTPRDISQKNNVTRSGAILGMLLLSFFIISLTTLYIGLVSGEVEKNLLSPAKQLWTVLNTPIEPEPLPTAFPTVVLAPTEVLSPTVYQQPAVQVQQKQAYCIRKNIREGEFASNKCYSPQDYEDLEYYLQQYSRAKFDYDAAVSSMNITCSGSDFFKDECEEDKKQKAGAEIGINNYRTTVLSIIAKGR